MDADQLRDYGLMGCFHTCCMMKGEEMAVITRRLEQVEDDVEEEDFVEEFEGITYLELQNSIQNVACQLYYRHGVRTGDRVLIYCGAGGNVGAEIVSIFACVSLGAPFVPVVNYMEGTLLQDVIDDASPQAAIVVAAKDSDDIVKALAKYNVYRCVLITVDGSLTPIEAVSTDIPDELPTLYPWSSLSCQLAVDKSYDEVHCAPLYIMYTSGSSGKPKGVLGSHHALINRLSWQYTRFPFDYNEIIIRRTPLTFIDSIVEIVGSILGLVPIYAPPYEAVTNYGIYGIIDTCNEIGITRITLLPTQLDLIFKLHASQSSEELHRRWSTLKHVVVSGSPCSVSLVNLFKIMLPFSYLINLYGSTEVAGDVLYAVLCVPDGEGIVDSVESGVFTKIIDDEVPIGVPMDNTFVYIRGIDDGGLVPEDVEGVLLCGGAHTAFGYNKNTLNDKFLCVNPYDPDNYCNQRLFYTGDIVCKSSTNGAIYWKGRADLQVKIRGQRVEINVAERVIGNVLNSTTGYALIATDSHRRTDRNDIESLELILLVEDAIFKPLGLSSAHDLKQLLIEQSIVAVYMPNIIIKVNDASLPLTTSGKIERNKLLQFFNSIFNADTTMLPSPPLSVITENNREADNILSQLMDILVSMNMGSSSYETKTFTALGGDSLLAIEFLWKIRQNFNVTLTVADIVASTMRELSLIIRGSANALCHNEKVLDTVIGKRKIISVIDNANSRDLEGAGTHIVSRAQAQLNPSISKLSISKLEVCWQYNMQKCVDSSPLVLINDQKSVVYAGSHSGLIICLDLDSGVTIWSNNVNQHIESPLVASNNGKVLYVCSYKKNDVDQDMAPVSASDKLGTVNALDASEGNILWETEVNGEIKAAPTLDATRGVVYVGCYDHKLYTINGINGNITQTYVCNGSIYSSPLLSSCGDYLYVATTKGQVMCLQLLPDSVIEQVWSIEILEPIFATMVIHDTSLLICTVEGKVHCVDRHTGSPIWQSIVATRPIFSSPYMLSNYDVRTFTSANVDTADILVVGSHDGFIRIVNVANGSVIYDYNVGCVIFAAPIAVVADDTLVLIISTTAGDVLALDVAKSCIISTIRLSGEIYSSPICHINRIYLGCRDDHLYALKLST